MGGLAHRSIRLQSGFRRSASRSPGDESFISSRIHRCYDRGIHHGHLWRTTLELRDESHFRSGRGPFIAAEPGGLDPCTGQESPQQIAGLYGASTAVPNNVVGRQYAPSLPGFRVLGRG